MGEQSADGWITGLRFGDSLGWLAFNGPAGCWTTLLVLSVHQEPWCLTQTQPFAPFLPLSRYALDA